MKKLFIVFFIAVGSHLLLSSACVSQHLFYREAQHERQMLDSAVSMTKKGQFSEAISLFKVTEKNLDTELTAHLYLAVCYQELGKKKRAFKELRTAFRKGLELYFVQRQQSFHSVLGDVKRDYQKIRPRYLATIDTVLRDELNAMTREDQSIRSQLHYSGGRAIRDSAFYRMVVVDSININRLREIVNKRGWPGMKMIGNAQTYLKSQKPDPSLLVIHSNQANNIYFLNVILKAIEKGEASWWDAYPIMKNLAFRLADDGIFKLRYTYVNTNGELDLERSFFQLKVLADFLNDNPTHKITLFTTKYADEEFGSSQYSSALVQVKNFLINEGITGRVEIEDTITVVTNDALGKFRMAYRMSR